MFIAYNQHSAWVHHYEKLGRQKKIVILACVVSKIRREFPSPTNNYTGFKEFIDFKSEYTILRRSRRDVL